MPPWPPYLWWGNSPQIAPFVLNCFDRCPLCGRSSSVFRRPISYYGYCRACFLCYCLLHFRHCGLDTCSSLGHLAAAFTDRLVRSPGSSFQMQHLMQVLHPAGPYQCIHDRREGPGSNLNIQEFDHRFPHIMVTFLTPWQRLLLFLGWHVAPTHRSLNACCPGRRRCNWMRGCEPSCGGQGAKQGRQQQQRAQEGEK